MNHKVYKWTFAREMNEIFNDLKKNRIEPYRIAGLDKYNLTRGDVYDFIEGNPNDRIRCANEYLINLDK